MKRFRLFLLFFLVSGVLGFCLFGGDDEKTDASPKNKEFVILLHGLGRGPGSMEKLEKDLLEKGYRILNEKYPSTKKEIDELIEEFIAPQVAQCLAAGAEKIHFVTHSLGGILLRVYLQDNDLPDESRVVMLSPPNKGSELVDTLKDWPIYEWFFGSAGQVLGTDEESLPNQLKRIDVEVGVIVGNKTFEPWFSRMIPGEDDGKVSVERARLDEMKDFLIVEESHSFIMRKKAVRDQVLFFLDKGYFEK